MEKVGARRPETPKPGHWGKQLQWTEGKRCGDSDEEEREVPRIAPIALAESFYEKTGDLKTQR